MKKIIQKMTKLSSKSKSNNNYNKKSLKNKRKSIKSIEKENKRCLRSNTCIDFETKIKTIRDQNPLIISKKSKQKQNKWKFGIIVKQKPRAQSHGFKNRPRIVRQSVKSCKDMIDKCRITRSIARRLIDKNLLDLDQEYLVIREEPTTNRILNDDVLKLVFGYLPLKDRFRIQRTCKQFYDVVQEMLAEQMALRIGNVADYYANCRDSRHSTLNANIEDAIAKKFCYKYLYMNDITASKEYLGQILWKCPQIRCLELHNFSIDVETVKWLKWHSPNIECLRFDEINYDLTARKWSQIGQTLGDRLLHLIVDANNIKNDLTNLVQHLPLLQEFQLRKYDIPVSLLLKRLSSNITSLSLTECEKLNPDSIKILANNRQIAANLQSLELQVSTGSTELDSKEIFSLICQNFAQMRHLSFQSHYCPPNISELIQLKDLKSLELHFSRDCFLDLTSIQCYELTALRSLSIHGAFFRPKMIELIGQQFPNCERLSLTNWAFCCGCPDNQVGDADEYDCPECDEKCCQSLLTLENLQQLYLEFMYSSDYIKPLILSLLTFEKLRTTTLLWYPVNTSINSINFINAMVTHGIKMAERDSHQLIRFQFDKYVIDLIDASRKLPKNLSIKSIV